MNENILLSPYGWGEGGGASCEMLKEVRLREQGRECNK